ncbi:MAG: YdeI family protein [Candidatus Kapaibacterium sp.]
MTSAPESSGERTSRSGRSSFCTEKKQKAQAAFDAFPPSHRKEYTLWIEEAKTEETRSKRLAQAMEWIAEGKSRNWKYMKK